MKISKTLLTALSIGLLMTDVSVASPIKPGTACTKVNQKITSAGMNLVCLKSGKKLIWSKTPTTTAVPTPAATSSTVTAPVAPTSFQDLQDHVTGIIQGAWLKAGIQIKNSSSSLGNVKILVGPNTVMDDPNTLDSLTLLSKLYSNIAQVKNLTIIKFGKSDIAWAQQQYDLLHPNNYQPSGAQNQCSGPNGCDGGNAGINQNGDGVILLGQGGSYIGQPIVDGGTRASNGQVAAHEYTHTVQMINAPCQGGCYGDLPQWFLEGSAEWSATAARFNGNLDQFLTFRNSDLEGQYSQSSMYTPEWVTTYLNPNPLFIPNQDNWAYWGKYDRWDTYAIGMMATEILVDINGPDSIMKLYKDVGAGQSFAQAFQSEFGISWADACPIIGKAISTEIQKAIKR